MNQLRLVMAPTSFTGGLSMVLTGVKSGLNKAIEASSLPTASCFPLADQVTILKYNKQCDDVNI